MAASWQDSDGPFHRRRPSWPVGTLMPDGHGGLPARGDPSRRLCTCWTAAVPARFRSGNFRRESQRTLLFGQMSGIPTPARITRRRWTVRSAGRRGSWRAGSAARSPGRGSDPARRALLRGLRDPGGGTSPTTDTDDGWRHGLTSNEPRGDGGVRKEKRRLEMGSTRPVPGRGLLRPGDRRRRGYIMRGLR